MTCVLLSRFDQAHICNMGIVAAGLNVLGDDQGMEVVGKLVAAQAVLFAKTSMDPLAREATREGAKEAVTGSYVRACILRLAAC